TTRQLARDNLVLINEGATGHCPGRFDPCERDADALGLPGLCSPSRPRDLPDGLLHAPLLTYSSRRRPTPIIVRPTTSRAPSSNRTITPSPTSTPVAGFAGPKLMYSASASPSYSQSMGIPFFSMSLTACIESSFLWHDAYRNRR